MTYVNSMVDFWQICPNHVKLGLKIVKENPNKKILVAIGIDHKYYIEKELEKHDVKVYQVENIEQF